MISRMPNESSQIKMAQRQKNKLQEILYKRPKKGLDDLVITDELAYLDNGEKFLQYDSSKQFKT